MRNSTGPAAIAARIGPPIPCRSVPDEQRVTERQAQRRRSSRSAAAASPSGRSTCAGGRTRPASARANPPRHRPRLRPGARAPRTGRERRPGRSGSWGRRETRGRGGRAWKARPDECLVPGEQRLLSLRPQDPGAHPETDPRRDGQKPECDQPGCAGDEPGDGHGAHGGGGELWVVVTGVAFDLTTTTRLLPFLPLTTSVCGAACGCSRRRHVRPGKHRDDRERRPDGDERCPDAPHQSSTSTDCAGGAGWMTEAAGGVGPAGGWTLQRVSPPTAAIAVRTVAVSMAASAIVRRRRVAGVDSVMTPVLRAHMPRARQAPSKIS